MEPPPLNGSKTFDTRSFFLTISVPHFFKISMSFLGVHFDSLMISSLIFFCLFSESGNLTKLAKLVALDVAVGLLAHHGCRVPIFPCEVFFSLTDASPTSDMGNDSSMKRLSAMRLLLNLGRAYHVVYVLLCGKCVGRIPDYPGSGDIRVRLRVPHNVKVVVWP